MDMFYIVFGTETSKPKTDSIGGTPTRPPVATKIPFGGCTTPEGEFAVRLVAGYGDETGGAGTAVVEEGATGG